MTKGITREGGLLFFFTIILSFSLVQARITYLSRTQTHSGAILLDDPFGASSGGRLAVTLNTTEENYEQYPWYYLVLFSNHQYTELTMGEDNPCTYPSIMRYEFTEDIAVEIEFQDEDRFHLYLLNCNELSFFYEGVVQWENPDGNQLSLDEQPMHIFYLLGTFPLVIFNLIFIIIACYYRISRKNLQTLQYIVFTSVSFNTINYVSTSIFYYNYAKTGLVSSIFEYVVYLSRVISDSLFLTAMLLIAMGWSIIRRRLPVKNRQLLWGSIILYGGFELSNFLCDSPDNICAIYMFQVFYHVIKFLITLGIIVAINSECDKIRREFDPVDQDRRIIAKKLQLYRSFRFLFGFLLFTPLLLIFLDFFILEWDEQWISEILNQLVIVAVYWRVAVLLRPTLPQFNYVFLRSHTPVHNQNDNHNNNNNIEDENVIVENNDEDNDENDEDNENESDNESDNIIDRSVLDLRSHFVHNNNNNNNDNVDDINIQYD